MIGYEAQEGAESTINLFYLTFGVTYLVKPSAWHSLLLHKYKSTPFYTIHCRDKLSVFLSFEF